MRIFLEPGIDENLTAWPGNKVRPVPVAEWIAAVMYGDFPVVLLVNGIVENRVEEHEVNN